MDPVTVAAGGLALGLVSILVLHFTRRRPPAPLVLARAGYWTEAIRVQARASVAPEALKLAIRFWRDLGYEIELSTVPNITITVDPALERWTPVPGTAPHRGWTYLETEERGQATVILSARIRLAPVHSALDIAHELGHALGLDHPPPDAADKHVMCDSDVYRGWVSTGCEPPKRRKPARNP